MIALLSAAFVGAGLGGLSLGLPGTIIGATIGVMLMAIFLLNRE